ncbi:helix-turn-helix domain-containing protein [Halostreptopolyspora alba]|uniref:XRE family transcriptional regulator n=1 Tax=Halostreptopolyspora alba TaxID=2487137 RepID=A0A3N0EF48_9ACTN|nr:XRE family transcriptional regulator [Nocardiopsaceae bacterium YIM 96095]
MPNPGPQVLRVQLGRELRRLREAAGITSREEVAKVLGSNANKVSKIEQGQGTLTAAEVTKLLKLFKVTGDEAKRIQDLATAARKRGSYGKVPAFGRGYVGMEADASSLRIFYEELIPGLLQTEAYARALYATSVTVAQADVDRLVQTRLSRRAVLNQDGPPSLNVVLGEAALRRHVGGKEVLLEQLEHLETMSQMSNVTLQVLPFTSGEHAALGTSFILLRVNEVEAEYVYLEDLTSGDFWDRPQHTNVYQLVFNRLQIAALGERETIALISNAVRELKGAT